MEFHQSLCHQTIATPPTSPLKCNRTPLAGNDWGRSTDHLDPSTWNKELRIMKPCKYRGWLCVINNGIRLSSFCGPVQNSLLDGQRSWCQSHDNTTERTRSRFYIIQLNCSATTTLVTEGKGPL